MSWVITPTFYGFITDADAKDYLARVHAAEGQTLEPAVALAVEAFVVGCKADGIWTAIKASCILAGARTRLGALTPLVGSSPTGSNLIDGDYDRKTGIKGNTSNKSINTNYAIPSGDQNNAHGAVWCSEVMSPLGNILFGSADGGGIGAYPNSANSYVISVNSNGGLTGNITGVGNSTGLIGGSRSNSSNHNWIAGIRSGSITIGSDIPLTATVRVLSGVGVPTFNSSARVAFYSLGQSLNLSLLNTRVTTLINAFAAAIP
jgi:hypothetical protein